MVELHFESMSLVVNDGVRLRYHEPGAARPAKHQLLVSFADGSALSASVQMYGALLCVRPALSTTRTTPPRWPSHRR
jgi:formamidopyrimidine-DNA glycosylase